MIRLSAFGCLKIRKLKLNPGCRTVYPLKTVDRVDLLENLWSVWRFLRVPLVTSRVNAVVLVKLSGENSLQFQKPSTRVRKNLNSRACPLGKQLSHLPFGKVSFKSYLPNKKIYLSRKYRTGIFLSPVYNVYPLVRAYMQLHYLIASVHRIYLYIVTCTNFGNYTLSL